MLTCEAAMAFAWLNISIMPSTNASEVSFTSVMISLDGGATWTTYQTAGAVIDKGVNWHFVYRPERPGRYLLKVRAVDGDGTVSDIVAEYAFEVES